MTWTTVVLIRFRNSKLSVVVGLLDWHFSFGIGCAAQGCSSVPPSDTDVKFKPVSLPSVLHSRKDQLPTGAQGGPEVLVQPVVFPESKCNLRTVVTPVIAHRAAAAGVWRPDRRL